MEIRVQEEFRSEANYLGQVLGKYATIPVGYPRRHFVPTDGRLDGRFADFDKERPEVGEANRQEIGWCVWRRILHMDIWSCNQHDLPKNSYACPKKILFTLYYARPA